MDNFLLSYRKLITGYLTLFLKQKRAEFRKTNHWGTDIVERFLDFTLSGKMIRGSLLVWSAEAYGKKNDRDVIKAAGALELFQSSILIHDDIIDCDRQRRGKRAMFVQYSDYAKENRIAESEVFGQNMGICAADIGFFLSYEILSLVERPHLLGRLINIFSKELSLVGLGEMQDISMSMVGEDSDPKEIIKMYIQKTARYTFSLPLILGFILSEKKCDDYKNLEKLGELLGLIFQIKDDELGLFGLEKYTGKPVGSDIREGKKTYSRNLLFKQATGEKRKRLGGIFGNTNISKGDIAYVKAQMRNLNIPSQINGRVNKWREEASKIISVLIINPDHKKTLENLMEQIISRNK